MLLHLQAAKSSQLACLRRLLALGADATVADRLLREPLHVAAERGHGCCLKTLIEVAKLPVDRPMSNGKTPLMIAAEHNQEKIVRLLLKTGADPNLQVAVLYC